MRILFSIAGFELRRHLRSWLFWGMAALLVFLTVSYVATDRADFVLGNVYRNAPFPTINGLIFSTFLGLFVSTAFVADAVLRDRRLRTHELLFAMPITRSQYLGGRFLGAFAAAVLLYVPAAVGNMVGGYLPGVDPERIGPFMIEPYVSAFALFVIPNMLIMCALFFGLATLTRSMMWTYVGVVAVFLVYFVAGAVADLRLAALLDPFAYRTFMFETRFWTPADMNTRVLGLEGLMLLNRLLWLAVGVLALVCTWAVFRPEAMVTGSALKGRKLRSFLPMGRFGRGRGSRSDGRDASVEGARSSGVFILPTMVPARGLHAELTRFWHQVRLEVGIVLRSAPFYIILVLAVLALVWSLQYLGSEPGHSVHPTTGQIVAYVDGMFWIFLVIMLTFYAGEMVWRDREAGMAETIDATPTSGWIFWGAKLVALVVIVVAVLGAGALTGAGFQLTRGYTDLQSGLYARGLFLKAGGAYVQIAVLALFVQALVSHKYSGFGIMALFILLGPTVYSTFELDHRLYRFSEVPPVDHSDMNGYGHFVQSIVWFSVYWSFAAAGMATLTHLLWVRGRDTGIRERIGRMRARFTPAAQGALVLSLAGFLLAGGWIFYNTNILNEYVSASEQRERQAHYEREYKRFEGIPQPRITGVYAEVDIDPERRRVEIRGRYQLLNRSDVPVDSLHILIPPEVEVIDLSGPGPSVFEDAVVGYRIFELGEPLAPGDSAVLSFELVVQKRGFVAHTSDRRLVSNGTSFDNQDFFPHIGYNRRLELADPLERRAQGLPPLQRMPPLEEEDARANNYLSSQADWIDFETVVSTTSDQRALAPGSLVDEWAEGNRRYFHYRTDVPIVAFWMYASAAWEEVRHRWNDEVDIEVYHHPTHDFNLERMVEAASHSLEYLTRNFSPYPHRELRFAQVHRLEGRAFPGIVAGSEDIFIARVDASSPVDALFHGIAHEVAHQWWFHQVIGADQQGATLMSEAMAEYLALVIAAERYGLPHLRPMLRGELERYLSGRSLERFQEQPLLRVEHQGYVHYRKGSLVMYWLRELFGEERLNRALAGYLERTAFQDPPYTTSLEFLDALREAVPDDMDPDEAERLFEDLFETITLWDLRAVDARATPREDGRWDVRLDVRATKLRSDGQGEEIEVPMNDFVEIGVFGAPGEGAPPEGRILHLERARLNSGQTTLEFVVDEEPRRAGIDPFNRLIDPNPDDNVVRVRIVETAHEEASPSASASIRSSGRTCTSLHSCPPTSIG